MAPSSIGRSVRLLVGATVTFCILNLAAVWLPGAASARAHAHAARAACAYADTPAVAAPRAAIKAAVVCLIDAQRRDHGLPSLHEDSRLDRAAQAWTDTMVATNGFSHGSNFSIRISAAGFRWSAAGENIATGFATPRSVVDAWMASTGHCRNILAPNYSAVGTGIVARSVNRFSGRNSSTWTQDFALPLGAGAPSGNWGAANGCPYRA
jgi:uncharacterized protein YkwD